MLETIKNAITQIVDFLNSVVSFVIDLVKNTLDFMKLIPSYVKEISDFVNMFFPVEIAAAIMAAIAIIIILRLVGRSD